MRALVLACLALAGCVGPPSVPEQFAPASRAASELQTRRYEGVRPEQVLPAAVAALQDFGFQVTKSDTALGLIVAQRGYKRTFGEYNYEFWQGYWQTMRNAFTFQWHVKPPDPAKGFGPAGVSAAVAVAPAGSGSEVRVSLHRYASRPTGEPIVVWAEELAEPEVYAKFFDLLAQALAAEKSGADPQRR
jgi:hypothetical protein